MSSDGGARHGADEPTSFALQPPAPQASAPQAAAPQSTAPQPPNPRMAVPVQVPHPDNPYATPAPATDSVPTPDPGTGRLIAGRYRLLGKLGHGGMGTVWRAKDETVDREVAVKEPRVPDHLPERERSNAFERMRREARAAARLDHPAVVNVHDVAVVDGQPWIVMELVTGRSLGDALQEGTLDARDAARIGLQVLGALEAAHAAGVLHRDVKPDNVLLGRYDRVVLTDFGIAQIEGETNLTDTGGFVGSPEYIAPERVLGQRPGPASDLWSLGVVLYAATEGVSPFRRSNTPATLQSVLNAAPAAPTSAPGPLADLITGLLAKDPSSRPNAAQVRAVLASVANPPAPASTQEVRNVQGPGGRRRLGRKSWFGLGAVVVAAAVAAAYVVIGNPFAGPLPHGWKKHHESDVAVTLAVPAAYKRTTPDRTSDKSHWVTYTDPSGSIWVFVSLDKKSEDTNGYIKDSAAAEMYSDNGDFKTNGSVDLDMGKAAKTVPKPTGTYQGRPSAENTVTYDSNDTQNPLPRELRILYYKTSAGDMYRLTVSYPGKGDFTARGREVAKAAIANLDIDTL
ncbi:serine/threonine protein kinase [Streptomyces sp. MBT65]|uniref:serine/threonine-protein kinase n=1 Tax=Streptomyces sp. MBT65 TaxID=1488395 RepID=UPI001909B6CA|nr:serine/threonine-protein kinase [Streptomyces sp. MBT65]MBK3578580.1 serine/threonine protein kinase [Streptomyces sp. MBT65]